MIRNPEIQFASADAIAAFQEERLRDEVAYLYENSPYYRRMFDGCGMQPGDIRDPDGVLLGQHDGVFFHTLGQRGGLAIGGVRGREPGPWYVVGKDVASNTLTIDQGVDSPFLMSRRLLSEPAHWVAGAAPGRTFGCTAQTRYRQPDQACHVQIRGDGSLEVSFVEPQRAVTPGQSVVLYRGEECLGGAVIAATDAPLEKARFETLLQQEHRHE